MWYNYTMTTYNDFSGTYYIIFKDYNEIPADCVELLQYIDTNFGSYLGVKVLLGYNGKYTISLNPNASVELADLDISNLDNLYNNIIKYFGLAIDYLTSDSASFSCNNYQTIIKEISKEKPTK